MNDLVAAAGEESGQVVKDVLEESSEGEKEGEKEESSEMDSTEGETKEDIGGEKEEVRSTSRSTDPALLEPKEFYYY